VLSTGGPAGAASVRVTSSTGISPTTPRTPSEGLSFSLIYSQFSLNCSVHVCVEMRVNFLYYIVVM
jgi:hypothetical protein